ncbi:DUF5947 family protein [Catellatospora sp. KI3]|uniref:DUF5947 family protein n=1 Tax=Catellatospora sp. KI3 TaxID=3041620 RepID=UPI002482CE48|nr:DUF5947 family protein [Catellatospora sp. KI3]MDI1465672.1 DUF5947 family protein [Catellatospora sp. KI3]
MTLRQYLRPAPGPDPAATAATAGPAAERCELCAAPLPARHDHLVDRHTRSLPCACRPCWLLFPAAPPGAAPSLKSTLAYLEDGFGESRPLDRPASMLSASGEAAPPPAPAQSPVPDRLARYVAIPATVTGLPGFPLTERDWAALDLPVRLAFVYRDSSLRHPVALYPSPAGAAESPLSPEALAELLSRHPLTAALPEDVAALLLHRGDHGPECFVVPIDACYRLVGLVRTHWRGFDGGDQARAAIAGFLDEVRADARTETAVA